MLSKKKREWKVKDEINFRVHFLICFVRNNSRQWKVLEKKISVTTVKKATFSLSSCVTQSYWSFWSVKDRPWVSGRVVLSWQKQLSLLVPFLPNEFGDRWLLYQTCPTRTKACMWKIEILNTPHLRWQNSKRKLARLLLLARWRSLEGAKSLTLLQTQRLLKQQNDLKGAGARELFPLFLSASWVEWHAESGHKSTAPSPSPLTWRDAVWMEEKMPRRKGSAQVSTCSWAIELTVFTPFEWNRWSYKAYIKFSDAYNCPMTHVKNGYSASTLPTFLFPITISSHLLSLPPFTRSFLYFLFCLLPLTCEMSLLCNLLAPWPLA